MRRAVAPLIFFLVSAAALLLSVAYDAPDGLKFIAYLLLLSSAAVLLGESLGKGRCRYASKCSLYRANSETCNNPKADRRYCGLYRELSARKRVDWSMVLFFTSIFSVSCGVAMAMSVMAFTGAMILLAVIILIIGAFIISREVS